MLLTEKEMTVLKDLQTQEKSCVDKYERYTGLAKDEELKQLFFFCIAHQVYII